MRSYLIYPFAFFLISLCLGFEVSQSASSEERRRCNGLCGSDKVPTCANNGITYQNTCLFNCAKGSNKRLKLVKTGSCAGTSLREYRGQTTTVPPFRRSTGGGEGSRGGWDSWFRF